MPVRRAILARLVIAIGTATMIIAHWVEHGSSSIPFGLGAVTVSLGLGLLPNWRATD